MKIERTTEVRKTERRVSYTGQRRKRRSVRSTRYLPTTDGGASDVTDVDTESGASDQPQPAPPPPPVHNAEVLDCMGSSGVQCHLFDCRLRGLRANESAVIRFRSRVWNSTLTARFEPDHKVVILQVSHIPL